MLKARDYRESGLTSISKGILNEYAEGAHIKPIGKPHRGPDTTDNMLCLCPNHHVSFDKGTLFIADDYSLNGEPGKLHVKEGHEIDAEYIRYHRGLK